MRKLLFAAALGAAVLFSLSLEAQSQTIVGPATLPTPSSTLLPTDIVVGAHAGQGTVQIPISTLLSSANGIGSLAGPPIQSGDLIIGFGDSITASGGGSTYTGPTGSPTSGGSGGGMGTPYTPSGTGWLDLVGEYYGAQVSNLGYGGTCLEATAPSNYCSTGSTGYARYSNSYTNANAGFGGLLAIKGPAHTWVTILYGVNDIIHGDTTVSAANYRTDLAAIDSYLVSQGYLPNHVIFLPMIPLDPGGKTQANLALLPLFNAAGTQLAASNGFLSATSFQSLIPCWTSVTNTPATPCSSDGLHPNVYGNQQLAVAVEQATYANTVSQAATWTSAALVTSLPAYVVSSATAAPTSIFTTALTVNDASGSSFTTAHTYPLTLADTSGTGVGLILDASGSLTPTSSHRQTKLFTSLATALNGIYCTELCTFDAIGSSFGLTLDTTGNLAIGGGLFQTGTTITMGGASGPAIVTANGAPSGSCVTGSSYRRTDSGASAATELYGCVGSAWVALVGAPPTTPFAITYGGSGNILGLTTTDTGGTNPYGLYLADTGGAGVGYQMEATGSLAGGSSHRLTKVFASYSSAVAGVNCYLLCFFDGIGSAFNASFDTSGNLGLLGGLKQTASSIQVGGSSGPLFSAGSGAPTGACTNGSFYVRTDASAAAGSTTYDCRGSAWLALSGG